MNSHLHRIVFNAARGQRMVVAETAPSHSSHGASPGPRRRNCRASLARASLAAGVLTAVSLALLAPLSAQAQIRADKSAPAHQQPILLQTANGVPLVNIRTPSAAGVSRNSFSQFDVQNNGAILNNVRSNAARTQIGGWVQANPFLNGGAARVIINEVNSSNPSYLKGPVEVAGQRAEVIIANPSGIRVNGGSFINAAGVTLTTGTPVMNNGNLESFRVQQGMVHVEGLGLETGTADYTRILARAMEVNAGLWAKNLTVVTGANDVKALASGADATATQIAGTGAAPNYMLDVAAIGGMYSGHIYLVGTEAGLGVNNRGTIAAQEGGWVLRADGWLVNAGKAQAKGDLTVDVTGAISNTGPGAVISSQGNAALTSGTNLSNTGGATVAATGTLDVTATGALTNTGSTVAANSAVRITAAGINNTAGTLASVQSNLNVNAGTQALDNTLGTISAGQGATVGSGALNTDQGLIQAGTTLDVNTHGQVLTNTNSGSAGIVAAGAATLITGDLNNAAGYLGTGGELTVAVNPDTGQITNTAGGQIVSESELNLTAAGVNNQGGNVQALGNIGVTAATINNAASTIEANGDVTLTATGALDNSGGTLSAGQSLTVQDTAASRTLAIINTGGTARSGVNTKQTGSDVLAPAGDIDIAAKNVQITEARETSTTVIEQKFSQSGLTLQITSPVISAVQTAQAMAKAASDTGDSRMKGLAAANTAFAANNALKAIEAGQGVTTADGKPLESRDANVADKVGGITLSASIGSSKSSSTTTQTSDNARGSHVAAGGNVNIKAAGAGAASDILIRGSDVTAGTSATLKADGDVSLLAAQDAASLSGSNKSSSGSIDISIGTTGFGVTASASAGRGNQAGDDVIQVNTHVTAGNTVTIQSGADTTLQGAVVNGETVKADVGGNLNITSLQDTSTYTSQQKSMGGGVTIGAGAGGSFNAARSNSNSDYKSVIETGGIKAGDGGFQVSVGNNTDLKGGVIASNQAAVEQDKNSFNTGGTLTTSDIQNQAGYSAKSTSAGVGTGGSASMLGISGVGVGVGGDSGRASGTTQAGISGIAGNTSVRSTDAKTGIQKIFDQERVQRELDAQAKITETFGREAPKAVASFSASQAGDLQKLLQAEADPEKRAALQGEIAKWGEGGAYRVLLHTLTGALSGGLSGATGAAVSASSANLLNDLQDSIEKSLRNAGLDQDAARTIAQSVTTLTAAGIGAAVGGTQGAATAATVDANNRQLHPTEIQWIKANAKRYSQQKGITEAEAEKQLASQAFRQVQFGVSGAWDGDANYFLKQAGQQALPGDASVPGQTMGYMFKADPIQKASLNMYASAVVSSPAALAFYANNGLIQPSTAQILMAARADAGIRDALQTATLGSAALAVGATLTPVLGWCLTNPVACNRIAIAGGEIVAGDALGPAGLGVVGTASAVKAVRSAEEANAAMRAKGWEPAWAAGTPVIEASLQPGTKVNMIVDAKTADAIKKGDPVIPGGWATFDDVSSVAADMRQRSAITTRFKNPADGPFYVVEMEITKPIQSNIGFVGKQVDPAGQVLHGGGTQVQFDETIRGADRNAFLRTTSIPKPLN